MYVNDLGHLPGAGSRLRPNPVETLFDTDMMSPFETEEMVGPEPVIFEQPESVDFPQFPQVATSPFEQTPRYGYGMKRSMGVVHIPNGGSMFGVDFGFPEEE